MAFAGLSTRTDSSDYKQPPLEMWPLRKPLSKPCGSMAVCRKRRPRLGWSTSGWSGTGTGGQRLRRAIQLNANNASAHRAYAHVLSSSGRHNEAIEEIAIARKLDPFSPIINTMTGQFLFYAGRHEEAIGALQKAFAIDPGFWVAHLFMGQIHERAGRSSAAIESLDKAYKFSGGNTMALSVKGYVLARSERSVVVMTFASL